MTTGRRETWCQGYQRALYNFGVPEPEAREMAEAAWAKGAGDVRPAAPSPDPGARPETCEHRSIIGTVKGGKVVAICEACGKEWVYPDLPPAPSPSAVEAPAGLTTRGDGQ